MEYRFLGESTKIQNSTFPYKNCPVRMLRHVRCRAQNGPITKNGVLPVTTLFFLNFVSVYEPLIKSLFDVPTTQMVIFILFVSTLVLFKGAFSL